MMWFFFFFFFQAEDGIRDIGVTGVQTCALPISGVRTLIPIPLSSHTNRIGTGMCWNAVHAAVLIAPVAVEWFADASPNVQAMMASAGVVGAMPSRDARSSETAAPTALGRCDAMVE